MTTNKKILSMGIILFISGIIAAVISLEPSRILQYIFVLTSLIVGIFGVLVGKDTKGTLVRSNYYSWIGFVLIGLSVALAIWATSVIAFITVLGFFLLVLGMIEFVFALQILNYEMPVPWKVVGLKLSLSAMTAIGGTWILTMTGYNVYIALLSLGILFVLVGLSIIQISRLTKHIDSSVLK